MDEYVADNASPVLSQPVAWIPEVGERCKVYWVNGGHNTATIAEMSKSSFRYLIDHNEYEMHLDRVHKFVSLPASASPVLSHPVQDDYFASLINQARTSADKAMRKFPQPNYVLLKVAEEAGEVVQAGVHYAEGRMTWDELEGEIVQLLAMLIRLVREGDQVNGIIPPDEIRAFELPASPVLSQQQAHASALTPGIILECMQQQWDEWDTDTNSFPPDFSWRGGNGSLSFEASSWAVNVARSIMKYVESSSQPVAPVLGQKLKLSAVREALGLFSCAIKCGESWSDECQSVMDAAKNQLAVIEAKAFVPEGWALVPVNPTDEMIRAGDKCSMETEGGSFGYWREMLRAAPELQGDSHDAE